MRIIQISDLHVAREGLPTHGVDSRGNFLRVLDRLAGLAWDLLLVTGDLCFPDGEAGLYVWIRERLDALGRPYAVLAGNHDDPRAMAAVFGPERLAGGPGAFPFSTSLAGFPVIFVDSHADRVEPAELERLGAALSGRPHPAGSPGLVFMHHPPLAMGCRFMDENYPLLNAAETAEALRGAAGTTLVFCGHCHAEAAAFERGLGVYSAPATSFGIATDPPELEVEAAAIGWRWIELAGGGLRTGVRYA